MTDNQRENEMIQTISTVVDKSPIALHCESIRQIGDTRLRVSPIF